MPGRVARIWREALGSAAAGPDDHFFHVGGTSRQVISLLRRVRLELGVDVPVQEFAGLADPAGAGRRRRRGARLRGPPPWWSSRPGQGRPVFLVPDAWGQLNLYAGLVERLATDRPVLGLHLRLTDADGRHRSIEEVAGDAVALLREAQPEGGPYSLVGYSFGRPGGPRGGRRPCARPRDGVPFLGLLDVRPPEAALSRRELAVRRWSARLRTVRSGDLLASVGSTPAPRRVATPPVPAAQARRGAALLPRLRGRLRRLPAPAPFDGAGHVLPGRGVTIQRSPRTLGAWHRRHPLV